MVKGGDHAVCPRGMGDPLVEGNQVFPEPEKTRRKTEVKGIMNAPHGETARSVAFRLEFVEYQDIQPSLGVIESEWLLTAVKERIR